LLAPGGANNARQTPRGRFKQDPANGVIALLSNSAMICRQWFV
jgi:hypothetical protein